MKTDRFKEHWRTAATDAGSGLRGVPVVVCEYPDATPAAPDAELDLHLLIVGRRIRVPLAELGGRPSWTHDDDGRFQWRKTGRRRRVSVLARCGGRADDDSNG